MYIYYIIICCMQLARINFTSLYFLNQPTHGSSFAPPLFCVDCELTTTRTKSVGKVSQCDGVTVGQNIKFTCDHHEQLIWVRLVRWYKWLANKYMYICMYSTRMCTSRK